MKIPGCFVRYTLLFFINICLLSITLRANYVIKNNTEADLNAAITAGGVITFAIDFDVAFTGTKILNNNITIDGLGHKVVMRGGGKLRLFTIKAANTNIITFKNLSLKDGFGKDDGSGSANGTVGGAIKCATYASLVLENVIFVNNIASNGGAILTNGNITANNCSFTENKSDEAAFSSSNDGNGGAVNAMNVSSSSVAYTTIEFKNCSFIKNRAISASTVAALGGSIYTVAATAGKSVKLIITGSTFDSNTATGIDIFSGSGGAIFNDSGSLVNISNTLFKTNSSVTARGGAIGAAIAKVGGNSTTLTINQSSFIDNSSLQESGAIDCSSITSLSINNCYFLSNIATNKSGGAIGCGGSIATISRSVFANNETTNNDGAAISLITYNNTGKLSISNSTFSGNHAGGVGGAINTYHGMDLTNCTFFNNSSVGNGGAIFGKTGGTSNISHVTFSGNKSTGGSADCIDLYNGANAIVKNSIFWDNGLDFVIGSSSVLSGSGNILQSKISGLTTISSVNPNLSPLANNNSTVLAGSTYNTVVPQTMKPLEGGSATGTNKNGLVQTIATLNTDQRGNIRDADGNKLCNPGAFEGSIATDIEIVAPLTNSFRVEIAPNPFIDQFKLNILSARIENTIVKIFNLSGNQILCKEFSDQLNVFLELGNEYKPGFYILQINQGSILKTFKIIKN